MSHNRVKRARVWFTPLTVGIGIGVWAGVSQALFNPTIALNYAISMGGHPSDLLNWIVNRLTGTAFYISQISVNIPVPKVLGLVLGALIASVIHKERGPGSGGYPLDALRNGFLVAFCHAFGRMSMMAATDAAYGNLVMGAGVVAIVAGALFATLYIKRTAAK